MTVSAAQDLISKASQHRECLYPLRDGEACALPVVSAHSISRSGGLRAIARDGHVVGLRPKPALPKSSGLELVGVGQASTFTGFCSRHDSSLFAPLEREAFSVTAEKMLLLHYRALAREVVAKQAQARGTRLVPGIVRGRHPSHQRAVNELANAISEGIDLGLRDLNWNKERVQEAIVEQQWDRVRYFVVEILGIPCIVCSTLLFPEVDFDGNVLAPAKNHDATAPALSFTITPTDIGGVIAFVWLDDNEDVNQLISTFAAIADGDLGNAAIRFAYEFSENTYCSPSWWDSLSEHERQAITARLEYTAKPWNERDSHALKDDGLNLVSWEVVERHDRRTAG